MYVFLYDLHFSLHFFGSFSLVGSNRYFFSFVLRGFDLRFWSSMIVFGLTITYLWPGISSLPESITVVGTVCTGWIHISWFFAREVVNRWEHSECTMCTTIHTAFLYNIYFSVPVFLPLYRLWPLILSRFSYLYTKLAFWACSWLFRMLTLNWGFEN